MTVNTDLARVQYNGNDVTTAFPFASRILDASHIRVVTRIVATGVETTLVLNTDYTVSGVGGSSCTVNTTDPVATGTTITLIRNVPLTQTADYVENDPFPAETHENALDKLTMIEQQQQDQISRALKFPETVAAGVNGVLPVPQDNYLLVWDGVLGAVKNSSTSFGDIEANLTIVANDIANVNTVAGSIANVNIVAADISDVSAVAGIAPEVAVVAAIAAAVVIVAANDGDISAVASDIASVVAVAPHINDVVTIAPYVADIETVADDIASVVSAATNMAAIIAAPAAASAAASSAALSQSWAVDAIGARPEGSAKYWSEIAQGFAAAINLPSAVGNALRFLRQKADETGFEYRTAAQVRSDISAATAAQGAKADTAIQAGDAFTPPVLHLQHRETSGTNGGTATAGSWQTRTLNTEVTDTIGSTLSSNTFTLPAGTYEIEAFMPALIVNLHKSRLYNVTDSSVAVLGTSSYSGASGAVGDYSPSLCRGRFTIASTKTFRMEHRVSATRASDGYGVASSFGDTEVYSDVFIRKVG